ncbi:histone deacetylase family protein [Hyphomicrobium sp.]|uniref:histone deacetylase family protein n=1 Tax=Hyphomicrobium sp. TaxID=82 RepID=UPI002FDD9D33
MATLLITHPDFLDHDTGFSHPERPDRMRAIDKVLGHESYNALERAEAPLREDVEEAILLVHPSHHLDRIKNTGESAKKRNGGLHLDTDTLMSAGSMEAALRAVGAGLDAVDAVMEGRAANAFCQIRPPGHHAETARPMGFCLFSNAAIAAKYARSRHGAERIAVVDFDVHHGNGTQEIFWSDQDLFYGSTHQMPLFPGTGELSETGVGNIWNAPLREGDAGETFRDAFNSRILGPLHDFGPDLIVISAGFDAHKRDPLGGLRLVEADFIWATEAIGKIAERHAKGRIVSVLEGGYDLDALAKSVGVHVRTLMDLGS